MTLDAAGPTHREILTKIAVDAMTENGLLPEFPPEVLAELERISGPAADPGEPVRDLRDRLWCSIDNDDSRDLDQLSAAAGLTGGAVTIMVAIADVDALVKRGSAIDAYARANTTSVYTPARIFPMLPEKLSTDFTSLNPNVDRLAMVVEMTIGADGALLDSRVSRAWVRSQAKLAYNSVAAWLEGTAPPPPALESVPGLAENLHLQDRTAQRIKALRHRLGALTLETIQGKAVFKGDQVVGMEIERKNAATEMIENFMIAANGVTARYLASKGFPSIRRVVLAPERWDRIVAIAAQYRVKLPAQPDARALEEFLIKQQAIDPLRFPDLSLSVIKLLGSGEYRAELPGDPVPDHFGLAARDYTHSTAPNRRYSDLLTQRLLKAAVSGQPAPYTLAELTELAQQCTEQEDAASKVERKAGKAAVALLLQSRIGEQFAALVTGASPKGVWARLLSLPVEGKVIRGFHGMDVGDRVRVELISVSVEQGFIDLIGVGRSRSHHRTERQ